MKQGSAPVLQAIESAPELYKDIMYIDSEDHVWFPSTITLPGKGMVFVDGTNADNWKWSAAKAQEITEEEKANFPKGQTHKMDMRNAQMFEQRDFMDALEVIGFFDIQVADEQ